MLFIRKEPVDESGAFLRTLKIFDVHYFVLVMRKRHMIFFIGVDKKL